MSRHPGTEGNDLKPRKVDATEDVSVSGRSIADAASGVFIQSDEPTDPPNGARWTDTSTQPPRTKIYDESTSAWIPINAGDRTFVQETEPDDLLQGDIWFDTSPEDGTDMRWFDGSNLNFLQFIPAIPDSAVHQWTLAESGSTASDQIGTVSLTHSGPTRVESSDFFDGAARDYDGVDDSSDADGQLNFTDGELTNSDFSIGLTVDLAQLDTSEVKDANLLHHQPAESGDPEVSISVCNDQTDVIDFAARDASNDLELSSDVSSFSGLLRVLVSFDSGAWDGTIWYNAVDQSPTSGNANFDAGTGDLRLGGTNDDGGYESTILDNVIIYNQSADQSLADADLSLQPWS